MKTEASSVSFTALGQTRQLTGSVLDQEGREIAGVALQWSSSDETVATVSATGLVTATGNGVAIVTAAASRARSEVRVSVDQMAASIELSEPAVSFSALGDTLRLSATVRDSGGSAITDADVTWIGVDTLIAIVSGDGLVTAVANGRTTVVATSGSALAASEIVVAQAAAAIALSADTLHFAALGDTLRLTATVSDALGSGVEGSVVLWTSSNSAVAQVSVDGLVTSVGNGDALLTATSEQAVRTAYVEVLQQPASISLQPDSLVLSGPGEVMVLAATVLDARGALIEGPALIWTSSDDGVATVNASGQVTAVATGTTTISANAGGHIAQAVARVEPQLTLVAAGSTNVAAEVATEVALSVRVEDLMGAAYPGSAVTWSTAASSGAITSARETTSDPTGHAGAVWLLGTGAGVQQAMATLESRGNVITVSFLADALAGPATSAALVADSVLLSARGETAYLAPTYLDEYGNATSATPLTWQSRDPGVADVSSDGLVTGQGSGTTYVVASLGVPTDSVLVTVIMRGAITITFDDGFKEAYDNAWPVFREFGLPGNIGVNPAQVGFPAYMTKANLDELAAAGWSIVSHSMTHDSLPKLSDGELDYELRVSQEWIDAQGYHGSNVFIVPYHVWGARERDAVGMYYEAARGTSARIVSPDSLVAWRPSNPYDMTGIDAEDLPYTTVQGRADLRALLQRTADEGAFIDVYLHHLPAANVADFRSMLQVIDEFRDRVLPYHELYPRFARTVF